MYIQRILLENFIGIWSGTGSSTLEIEFPEPGNLSSKIILLSGRNGSGKSTLLSTLHPYSGIYDGRDDQFIRSGHDGLKEIDIVHNNVVYKIRHVYKNATGKFRTHSYISQGDEELNPNGGVNSFKDIVYQIWNLEEDFFKVGRLASTTSNFIDMTTGARKDLIVSYLPALEPYLEAFKSSNLCCKDTEKELQFLAREIKNLSSAEELTAQKNELTKVLATLTENHKQLVFQHGGKTQQRAALEKDPLIKNVDNILAEIKRIDNDIEIITKNGRILVSEYPWLATEKDNITQDYIKAAIAEMTEQEKAVLLAESERRSLTEKRADLLEQLKTAETHLKNFDCFEEKIEDLEAAIAAYQEDLKKKNAAAKKMASVYTVDIDTTPYTVQHRSFYKQLSNDFVSELSSLQATLDSYEEPYRSELVRAVLSPDELDNKQLQMNHTALLRQQNELQSQTRQLAKTAVLAEIIDQRPEKCKIDSCAFLEEGWKGKQAQAELDKLNKNLAKLTTDIKNIESRIREIERINNLKKTVRRICTIHSPYPQEIGNLLALMDENYNSENEYFLHFLPEYVLWVTEDYRRIEALDTALRSGDSFFNYLALETEINQISTSLENSMNRLAYNQNNAAHITALQENIVKLQEQSDALKTAITDNQAKVMKFKAAFSEMILRIEIMNTYMDSKVAYLDFVKLKEEKNALLSNHGEQVKAYGILVSEIQELETQIKNAENSMSITQQRLTSVESSLKRHSEYSERHQLYTERFAKEQAIRDSCDPKKGIPLQFLQDFLETTEGFANELFDIAYGGAFQIKFVVDEKSFTIPVYKDDGETRPDVKYASDGETSLIKTIVSLSLLSRYTRLFPIFCLDEVDAVLDARYRSSFVNILNTQIHKLALQQVFIISHNEELLDDSINLILFPGHNIDLETAQNNIIAQY